MHTPSDSEASFILVGGEANALESQILKENETPATQAPYHPSQAPAYSPGSVGSYAHDWSRRGTGEGLRIHGRHFVDSYGRVCGLRGVNLSGSCKSPVNHDNDTFPAGHEVVTFVGRPFPLEEAHEHFSRLRRWGFTFLRFLVTWEAVEHEGPGIYDTDYLDYIRKLLSLLPHYGMVAFVSLHQDVWSRYSGGSGAPAWTLEAAGFDLEALEDTGAAWLTGVKGGGHAESERGVWPCNYTKLAASTMATLFWAGDTFAPKILVMANRGQEISIQQFLQNAFIEMFETLAQAVGDLDGVLGFEMMNEPHSGYIGRRTLHAFDYNTELHLSHMPSVLQSFTLGAGHPTAVPYWTRSFPMPTKKTSEVLLNPEGRKAWRSDGPTQGQCLWQMHGVWGWDTTKSKAVVLRETYFNKHPMTGKKIDWYTDYYFPFLHKWASRVRNASATHKIIFVEAIPNEFCPPVWTPERQLPDMVYAPHWYDLNSLFAKAFGDFTVNVQGLSRGMFLLRAFYWGQKGARANFSLQIRNIVESSYRALGEKPVIIGECGIPMDMNNKEAFETEDFTWQMRMMDAVMTGLERSLIGFTLWNYNPSNDDQRGDDWNGENFSWFSRKRGLPPFLLYYEQDAPSLDNGARILPAVVRPYPAKTAGIPLRFEFEMTTGTFIYEWTNPADKHPVPQTSSDIGKPLRSAHPPITARETEIFLPSLMTHGRKVNVYGLNPSDIHRYDESRQTLFIVASDTSPGKIHRITVSLHPPLRPEFEVNDFWGDFGPRIISVLVVLLGIVAYWFILP